MSASAVVGPAHHYYSSATAKLSETRCRGNHSPKRHLSEINSQLLKLTLRPTHRGGLAHLIWNQAQLFSSKVSFASSQEELRDATPAGSAAESPKAGLKDTVRRSRCQLSKTRTPGTVTLQSVICSARRTKIGETFAGPTQHARRSEVMNDDKPRSLLPKETYDPSLA